MISINIAFDLFFLEFSFLSLGIHGSKQTRCRGSSTFFINFFSINQSVSQPSHGNLTRSFSPQQTRPQAPGFRPDPPAAAAPRSPEPPHLPVLFRRLGHGGTQLPLRSAALRKQVPSSRRRRRRRLCATRGFVCRAVQSAVSSRSATHVA